MTTPIFQGPIKGFHLLEVAKKLGAIKAEASYIMGLPITTWYKLTKYSEVSNPIEKVSYSIMTRFAMTFPERVQQVSYPTPHEVYAALQSVEPDATMNRVAFLLGRDVSGGHRWLKQGHGFDGTTRRLARYLVDFIKEGRLKEWEKLTKLEHKLRNAPSKSYALPKEQGELSADLVYSTDRTKRLFVVGDLDTVLSDLQLSTKDVHYYLGVSMHKWYAMKNKLSPLMPVRDPSLCLLMRLY